MFYYFHECSIHSVFITNKGCIICLTSLSKFSNALPAFTCARIFVNLWSICLRVNIFRNFSCFVSFAAYHLLYHRKIVIAKFRNLLSPFVKVKIFFILLSCLFDSLPPILTLLNFNWNSIRFFQHLQILFF